MPRTSAQDMPYSLIFNGTTTVVDAGIIAALNAMPNNFWVSGWIKPSIKTAKLIGVCDFNASKGFYFGIESWVLKFTKRSVADIYSTSGRVLPNVWTHIAACVEANNDVSFYVNGVYQDTAASATPINTGTAQRTTIGAYYFNPGYVNLFKGMISNVRIYPGTATEAAVQADMRQALAVVPDGQWNLSEGVGPTAYDTSGNGNNGTITDGAWSIDTPSKLRSSGNVRAAIPNVPCSFAMRSSGDKVVFTGIRPTSGAFSFGFSVKNVMAVPSWNRLVSCRDLNNTGGFELEMNNSPNVAHLLFRGSDDSSVGLTGSFEMYRNTWCHIAVVVNSPSVFVYRDGLLVTTLALTGAIGSASGQSLTIGSQSWFTSAPAQSNICNFAFADGIAWSRSQVAGLANGVLPGCTVYAPLAEGTGTIAYDRSGNGNNGTISAGTFVTDVPSASRYTAGGNLVFNSDFSYIPPVNVAQTQANWINGTATGSSLKQVFGWAIQEYGGSGSFIFDTAEIRNNKPTMKFSTLAANSYISGSNCKTAFTDNLATRANAIVASPNTSYTLNYEMKTNYVSGSSTGGATVYVHEHDGTGYYVTNHTSGPITSTTGWTRYTTSFTTAANTRYLVVSPGTRGHTGTGTLIMDAWFSNIDLRITNPAVRSVV